MTNESEEFEEEITTQSVVVVDKPAFEKNNRRSNWFVIALMALVVIISVTQGFVAFAQINQEREFDKLAENFDQEAAEGQEREQLLRGLIEATAEVKSQSDAIEGLLVVASELTSPDRAAESQRKLQEQIDSAVKNIDCNNRQLLKTIIEELEPSAFVPLCEEPPS